MDRRLLASPLALAAIVTLANAVKPVLVDDTAYLMFARHIAAHPLDPYGFDIFWYDAPEPAMGVLCPPVVPYWLAAGVAVFGQNPILLKLTLFPFVWLLAWSLRELLTRFAHGTEAVALPLLMLSPAVLPTVNLMLDVPAVALGLGAVAVFARGGWVVPGVLAGLAMQTKYTALLVPPVIVWYGLTHRRTGPAILAGAVAAAVFAGWEAALVAKYGQSHFAVNVDQQSTGGGPAGWLQAKAALLPGLTGHLGLLAVGIALYAGRALGVPRWVLVAAAAAWSVGAVLVCVVPLSASVLIPRKLTLPMLVWRTAGTAVLLSALACALVLLLRRRTRPIRRSAGSVFLVGWVLAELLSYFVLTPFPAARRLIGPTLAIGLLAARTVSRVSRAHPNRRPPSWVLTFGVTVGVLTAALDAYDAYAEKALAERAAARVAAAATHVWYSGHWGFQFYCERAGMRPFVAGRSEFEVRPGDFLVLPAFPDAEGFFRPFPGQFIIWPPDGVAEQVDEHVWDDAIAGQTIPNFYGGEDPIRGRDHPRLRVVVFRVVRPWVSGP